MQYIIITHFKKKFFILLSILLFWIGVILAANVFIDTTLKYTVTVNHQFSFTYTQDFMLSDIYSRDMDAVPYLQASNSQYKKFIEFKSQEEDFQFSYPEIFALEKQNFPGSEILYHLELQNKKDEKYIGFVQVWNMPYPLDKFLESSKQNSLAEFLSFSSEKIRINNLDGYFWDYTVQSAQGNYKNLEVFFKKGTKLYRISYYIPENKYTQDEYEMFWKMVKSFKVG